MAMKPMASSLIYIFISCNIDVYKWYICVYNVVYIYTQVYKKPVAKSKPDEKVGGRDGGEPHGQVCGREDGGGGEADPGAVTDLVHEVSQHLWNKKNANTIAIRSNEKGK